MTALLMLLALAAPLPPCAFEDSSWCYWNAATMGNGSGRSFIALGDRPLYLD